MTIGIPLWSRKKSQTIVVSYEQAVWILNTYTHYTESNSETNRQEIKAQPPE